MKPQNNNVPVITIDGPSGSGKGTIAHLLAQKLNFNFLDSGSLYRLTALAAQDRGIDWDNEDAVAKVAAELDVEFQTDSERTVIMLDGKDATAAIRKEEISLGASKVAAHPRVREALLDLQKSFRQGRGLVADGRDMGTMVFPQAELKIFLTAGAEERAQRRHKQLLEKGESVSLRALLSDIQARDERDSQRAISPLKPAPDAIILDSTHLSIVEVLNQVLAYASDRGMGSTG